jgi:hypothetical protein
VSAELLAACTRFAAAEALARAIGSLVVLERCERATGRPWVRDGDREWVKACRRRWEAAR